MWTRRADPRCLRGLKFVYRTERAICPDCFGSAVRVQLPDQLVEAVESMGEVELHRMILQFRFELRFGMNAREVEVHHRKLASEDARARTFGMVESALTETLETERCAHA